MGTKRHSTELSEPTRARLAAMFPPAEVVEAERVLVEGCGDHLVSGSKPLLLERIHFAAIRSSGGRLSELRHAVSLAQSDWRDLLMNADFATDTRAHLRWRPRPLGAVTVANWHSGGTIADVECVARQRVVVKGWGATQMGYVAELTQLDPEPRYRVELDSGQSVEVYQRNLATAE